MKQKALVGLTCVLSILLPLRQSVPAPPEEQTVEVSVMNIAGDWEAVNDLPWQAVMLSLQGLANKQGPNIYLVYPNNYKHPNVRDVLEYYEKRHNVVATEIPSIEDAVRKYREHIKGYVVWDPEVVPSLMVAFTVAGLEEVLVITDAYLPLVNALGLKPVADFRGKFGGMKDVEIFRWAYSEYWDRCSKDYLVYLGEWCKGLNGNPGMQPGIADFGIVHKAFFTDLSTSPADAEEYKLADKIMSEMNTYAYVFGWHSYCKDQEAEHLTMVSRNALVVAEGLATLPNMSFHGQMPVSPGFEFKQKAKFNPDPEVGNKVYVTLIQSDGLGIGSWLRPGRGEIPYGWETNMEWIDLAPALLQYYYEGATTNDFFIGSLSGPGYLYPKAYPVDKLPGVLRKADTLMQRLDLHVFGIMDYFQGNRMVGNIDLPKYIIDIYYENMPHVTGFLNGYGPANTYDGREGRPLISYNYYVHPRKTVEEVVFDMKELAALNKKRPYFLAVHVRESNDVQWMKKIVEGLGPEFKIVPPAEFTILAGKKPTMTKRFLDFRPDYSGHWKLDRKASYNVLQPTYELNISQRDDRITISTTGLYKRFTHHRELKTTKTLVIGGDPVRTLEDRWRRFGHAAAWGSSAVTRARWGDDGKTLVLISDAEVETSQGTSPLNVRMEFKLSEGGMTLAVTERRSTWGNDDPVSVFVFRKVL